MNDNNIGSFKILFDALTDDAVTNDLFHKFKNINHINEALCIQITGYNAMEFLAIYESIVKNNEFKMRGKGTPVSIVITFVYKNKQ